MDSTKSIFKSARHFFSGTVISRISGALRDIVLASAFGTKETIAAFFIAFRLAHLLRRLFGEGALQTAFVPKFEKLRNESPERAARFFTSLYLFLGIGLIGLITAIFLTSYFFINLLDEGNKEILFLTVLMLPSLLFICLWGLNCSLMQCEKCFFLPSVAPVFFNVVWIFGALIIGFTSPAYPMGWLALTIIFASVVQWLVTLPKTCHLLKQWNFPIPSLYNLDVRALAKPLFLGILGVAAMQINSAVDPLFARYASGEGPAFLWYAIRIQQVPLALFGIALSSALLPPLSRALEQGDLIKYRSFLMYARKRCLWMMVPATFAVMVLGKLGITGVYGHGHFSIESINGTTACLNGYALGLVPMALVLIYAPAFYAKGDYLTPSIASGVSVLMNLGLNALFILGLGYGPESVAYATSLSSLGNYAVLEIAMRMDRGKVHLIPG